MNAAPKERSPAGGPGFGGQHELALVDAPASYRKRPAAGTARADVLAALESGERLTSLEAWQRFGTSRLAADVFELRRMGWPVIAAEIKVPCREGRTSRVAQYRIAKGGAHE